MIRSFFTRTGSFRWLVFLGALVAVATRIWIAEDAYITFRVVENLFLGNGPVYNAGEIVEAFTHPLWFLFLVFVRGSGLTLATGSTILSLVLVILGLTALLQRRTREGASVFPLGVLALFANSGFRDFAVSGMEFPLVFVLLVTYFLERDRSRFQDRPFLYGTLFSWIYLTRPELALIYVMATPFFFLEIFSSRKNRGFWKKSFLWFFPAFLFAGSYHVFRLAYYGEIFPNTYYAKSGLGTYYIQGIKYLIYTVLWSPSLWIPGVLFPAGLIAGFRMRKKTDGLDPAGDFFRYTLLDGLTLGVLILYVVRTGGDFMAFRFLLPELVYLALATDRILPVLLETGLFRRYRLNHTLVSGKTIQPILWYGLAGWFILLSFSPVPRSEGYVANEREFYVSAGFHLDPRKVLSPEQVDWAKRGRAYRELQSCLGYEPFWISNSQYGARCMRGIGLGYSGVAAGPRVLIQDEQGLSDTVVARSPIVTRFRPGHEHYLNLQQVIDKGALFCSTGDIDYDRTMKTRAGIVINLDPDLLSTLPDIRNRLKKLVELKKAGSPIVSRLEARWKIRLESLLENSTAWQQDPFLKDKNHCWQDFPELKNGFFY